MCKQQSTFLVSMPSGVYESAEKMEACAVPVEAAEAAEAAEAVLPGVFQVIQRPMPMTLELEKQ